MLRRLFTILSVVSLLLCVTTCVLWVRSYSTGDEFDRVDRSELLTLRSGRGRVEWLSTEREGSFRPAPWHHDRFSVALADMIVNIDPIDAPRGSIIEPYVPQARTWTIGTRNGTERWRQVIVPLWAVAGLLSVLPLLQMSGIWRRRRGHRIGCATCGYDLRATPGRCPECGTTVA